MHPVLFSVGPVDIRVYNLMIAAGILAGALLAVHLARHRGRAYQATVWNFTSFAVLGAIAGARVWEMVWAWPAYADKPLAMVAFWQGGMSIQGAVLGGLAVALVYARVKRLHVWQFLDYLAPGMVLGQGIGRIGCLFNGDAFGLPVAEVGWWPEWLGVVYAEGTPAWHVYGTQPLVPAEAMEGLADFAICVLLLRWKPKNAFHGWKTLAYGILYSVVRFSLEFLRADSLTAGGLKAAQLLSLAAIAACGVLWFYRTRQTHAAGA